MFGEMETLNLEADVFSNMKFGRRFEELQPERRGPHQRSKSGSGYGSTDFPWALEEVQQGFGWNRNIESGHLHERLFVFFFILSKTALTISLKIGVLIKCHGLLVVYKLFAGGSLARVL